MGPALCRLNTAGCPVQRRCFRLAQTEMPRWFFILNSADVMSGVVPVISLDRHYTGPRTVCPFKDLFAITFGVITTSCGKRVLHRETLGEFVAMLKGISTIVIEDVVEKRTDGITLRVDAIVAVSLFLFIIVTQRIHLYPHNPESGISYLANKCIHGALAETTGVKHNLPTPDITPKRQITLIQQNCQHFARCAWRQGF